MKLLLALIALTAARRVEEEFGVALEANETGKPNKLGTPQPVDYPMQLVPHAQFKAASNPVLVKSLEIPAGQSIVMELQERRKPFTNNWYDIFVSGKNGSPLPRPLHIGTSVSTMTHQNFKDQNGKKVTRMHWSYRPSIKTQLRSYVVEPGNRKHTYYTFEKLSYWGMHANSHAVGYVGHRQEVFTAYFGKCPRGSQSVNKPGCDGLALTAKGHFLGFNFKFYKPGQTEPIAFMTMKHRYWGLSGKKERYQMTVNHGGDALMLSHLVAFIDLANNMEAAQNN